MKIRRGTMVTAIKQSFASLRAIYLLIFIGLVLSLVSFRLIPLLALEIQYMYGGEVPLIFTMPRSLLLLAPATVCLLDSVFRVLYRRFRQRFWMTLYSLYIVSMLLVVCYMLRYSMMIIVAVR